MDLSFSREDEAFRQEVREFIAEAKPKLPKNLGAPEQARLPKDDYLVWHRLLYKKGWVAPAWPKEFGGAAWSVTRRYIFSTETARESMPTTLPFGLGMVGPVIYTFGNEAQKKKFLPRIFSGDDWWCQGYSEPGAGSDSRACAVVRCAMAIIMWSQDRKPGPRWRNMPTGFSVWCAPIPIPSPRKASPSF